MSSKFQPLCAVLYVLHGLTNPGISGSPLQSQVSTMAERLSGVERLFGNASKLLNDFVDDVTETGALGEPKDCDVSSSDDLQSPAPPNGSTIMFKASPNNIKESVTDKLSLRCEMNYANESKQLNKKDEDNNIDEVLSIVIMQNSKDIAMVTHGQPAKVVEGSNNIELSGQIMRNPRQMSFLQLTFNFPTEVQVGNYKCQITTLRAGHAIEFFALEKVIKSQPSIADLTALIRDNERKHNEYMDKLREELNHQKNKTQTAVMFCVAITKHVTLSAGQPVIYDKVYTNVGQAYNTTSGLFVCPKDGYYHFAASAVSNAQSHGSLHVQVNGVPTFSLFAQTGWNGMSNSGILQLSKGDTVGVLCWRSSSFGNSNVEVYTTFNGHLLSLI